MKPYEYDEPDQDVQLAIKVGPGGSARVRINDCGKELFVDISASRVPAAALALYEAAGMPEPLILPRPEYTGGIEHAGSSDRYAFTSRVGLKVAIGWRGIEPAWFTPDEALEFAAHIAVNALAIKGAEPDPAEVEELAAVLQEASVLPAPLPPVFDLRDAARAVLLAGWKREPER